MTVEPSLFVIRVQNTYVFSLCLFLAKYTSIVVLLLLKVVLKRGFKKARKYSAVLHM